MSDSVWPHPWDSPGKNTVVGCHFLLQCMKVKGESEVAQSCLTLHDPMDCSLPGSSVHGIFQARVLEWGAIAFSVQANLVCYKSLCYLIKQSATLPSLLFSHSVLCTLWDPMDCSMPNFPVLHHLPETCSNSCPLSLWCHPTISSSVIPFSSFLQSFPASGSFLMNQLFTSGGPSIRISPSNEYSGLISFRMDWLDLLAVQGTLKSLLQHHTQLKSINSSALSLHYGPTLTSIHDYWKSHSFDYMDLCQQSNVSAF